MTSQRIYEDYTDEEIAVMEREFDEWQRWIYEQCDHSVVDANASEVVANASQTDR